jgi:hypothetical protein
MKPYMAGSSFEAQFKERMRWKEGLQAGLYIVLLLWLNAYICREFFWSPRAPMNSMHGFWSAIARWAGSSWWTPTWWPYWDCGIPFEFTYAPLAPGLTALIAALRGIPQTLAIDSVSGMVYCLGPVTLFLMAWLLTRLPGYSFSAALLYSLTAPSQLLVPDGPFSLQHVWDARRFYLMAAWDETPHMVAMTLLPLAVMFLVLSLHKPRWIYRVAAIFSIAGMALASAFGPVEIAMAALCLLCVLERERLGRNLLVVAAVGACAYAISSPFLPPTLMHAMHTSAERGEGDLWNAGSLTALALVTLGWAILWRYLQRWTRDWWLQFVVLFFYLTSTPSLLATYLHRAFLPQPNRYKVEMEFAFALAAVFGARYLMRRLPGSIKAALLFLLLALSGEQIVSHRHFAKNVLLSADITQTIEYRASTWAAQNLPGTRVMMPGSIAQWANAFTGLQQFSGSSWSMAYNHVQQRAVDAVYTGAGNTPGDPSASIAWLIAYGVGAVCVSGKQSPEFWKPYQNPAQFQGVLPALWSAQDTTIYRVPQRTAALAHVIPQTALLHRAPAGPTDLTGLKRYVAALDDASLPLADFSWQDRNRIRIHANTQPGQILSVQVTYYPGWLARSDGRKLDLGPDGLGLMWVRPARSGPCDIEMVYTGGWELRFCRWLSLLAIVGLLIVVPLRRWRRSR